MSAVTIARIGAGGTLAGTTKTVEDIESSGSSDLQSHTTCKS
jgi:hypothetical protein